MKKEDEQIIEDVRFILNSGDTEIIHTLKVTIPAYLQCIAVKKQSADLEAEQRRRKFTVIKNEG